MRFFLGKYPAANGQKGSDEHDADDMIERSDVPDCRQIKKRPESHDGSEEGDDDQREIIEKSDERLFFPDEFGSKKSIDYPGFFPAQLLFQKLFEFFRHDGIGLDLVGIDRFVPLFQ